MSRILKDPNLHLLLSMLDDINQTKQIINDELTCLTNKIEKNLSSIIKNKSKTVVPKDPLLEKAYSTWTHIHRTVKYNNACLDEGRETFYRSPRTICDNWKTFDGFLKDVGLPPHEEATLYKEFKNLHYGPLTCKWYTQPSKRK